VKRARVRKEKPRKEGCESADSPGKERSRLRVKKEENSQGKRGVSPLTPPWRKEGEERERETTKGKGCEPAGSPRKKYHRDPEAWSVGRFCWRRVEAGLPARGTPEERGAPGLSLPPGPKDVWNRGGI
jgi:hypothetical protein